MTEAVDAAGTDRNKWIRRALRAYLSGMSQADFQHLDELAARLEQLRRELAPIGGNLNQIAWAFNARDTLDRKSLGGVHVALIQVFKSVIQELRNVEAELQRFHR